MSSGSNISFLTLDWVKVIRYILLVIFWLTVLVGSAKPPKKGDIKLPDSLRYGRPVMNRVEGGRKVAEAVDSLLLSADSLKRDSILSARLLLDSLVLDSLTHDKFILDSIGKNKKFSFTKDTIAPAWHLIMSFVPGLGQIYNGQWFKAPIFYAALGGFAVGGAVMHNKSVGSQRAWQASLNRKDPESITKPLQQRMYDEQSASTIFYCLAGASYLYSVADAVLNYRGKVNHVRKATMLAAIFPGAGFFYTRTYWRLPIYYGLFAAFAAVIDYNNRYYIRFQRAYDIKIADDPNVVDEFGGRYSADVLRNSRDAYRRDRDFGIIATAAVYLLSVIDTYVTAMLKNWDVSPDLSLRVEPALFNQHLGASQSIPTGAGMSLKLKF